MEYIVLVISAVITVAVFYFGLITGVRLTRGKEIEPNIKITEENIPVTREYKEKKEEIIQQEMADEELERINIIAQNIEAFDGTSRGQRSV